MSDKITYISAAGLEKIKSELEHLKTVRRRELRDRVEAAKALGDLSENVEYHEAKNELGFVESRIRELEEMLKNVSIIPSAAPTEEVHIGSTVEGELNGKMKTYKIVGSNEADPVAGLISNESPLGSAFLGHRVGETVAVETPAGTSEYKIVSIG